MARFVDQSIEGIDNLLPPAQAAQAQPSGTVEDAPAAAVETTADDAAPAVQETPPASAPVRTQPGPKARGPRSRRTLELPESVAARLQTVRAQEKADAVEKGVSPRTYADIVMDAISDQAAQLATHWASADDAAPAPSLFPSRQRPRAQKVTRTEPVKRIMATGFAEADFEVFDKLIEDWRAPSFAALVIAALDLYLPA